MTTARRRATTRATTPPPLVDLPPIAEIVAHIGLPFEQWARQCHAVSLAIVKTGLLPGARVARGTCDGVGAQHSWIILGADPYAPETVIVDPTLWSYVGGDSILVSTMAAGRHRPKGFGPEIIEYGRPPYPVAEPVPLAADALDALSEEARWWVEGMFGPLDRQGWVVLLDGTMVGWPAGEILAAMDDTPALTALVPIDLLGMLTDRNPGGLYLPGPGATS